MLNELLQKINLEEIPFQAVKLWGGNSHSLKLVNEGMNFVYRFQINQEVCYLRLTLDLIHKKEQLENSMEFQHHLYNKNVSVSEPLPSKNQLWVESIRQGNLIIHANACREIKGKNIQFNLKKNSLYYQWGLTLGKLHQHSQNYPLELSCHFPKITKISEKIRPFIKLESPFLQDKFHYLEDFFNQRIMTKDNYGLTHGDHREGNVFFKGDSIYLIDFDNVKNNWFMDDFCRPFLYSIIHDNHDWKNKFKFYIDGYRSTMFGNSIQLHEFSQQIEIQCMSMYLFYKYKWSRKTTSGGQNKEILIEHCSERLINSSWKNNLPLEIQ